ncbi:MAG TPA: LPS-assembly protein LptD [Pseudolabrys sp.]|nr:LPS-assembly protein LptD [Pseudolabrys sp.]
MAALPIARPPARRRVSVGALVVFGVAVVLGGCTIFAARVEAQEIQFPEAPPRLKPPRKVNPQGGQEQMLVNAREINYDYTNSRVSAVGDVQIYYGGSTLEADRVTYDQKTKRLRAEGNVRLTDPDGKITYGSVMDLSDDYRDGFVDSLRVETPEQTRLAAVSANRTAGNFTVFQSGVYTACEPCKDDPKKPPLWQIKAARIIHDQGEKMIYFEDAKFEFWGKPIAYFPYFSTPDPTVKRKTGFLFPSVSVASKYGSSIEVPYYWALSPDYDFTFSPSFMTKQGPMLQGEWRQRLLNGAYAIRASGLRQWDPGYFVHSDGTPTPGYRDWRGSVESNGMFALNDKWVWGWDALMLSDKTYLQDYSPSLSKYRATTDIFGLGASEGVSQLYLSGRGDRSYFDARSIYYLGYSESDNQSQIPVIHPVVDYTYTFKNPVAGGELGYNVNFTSLSRNNADFDPITTNALNSGSCLSNDPAVKTPANCLLRGIPGSYSRFSAETHWKRSFTDPLGQVFTPFAMVRADVGSIQITDQPGVSNYLPTGDNTLMRTMPTAGLEYRYPFVSAERWGTQTFEPIAQVIVRPNETQIGSWPNEDAQSLIFDDSNLFRVDKYSGWDRVEGGGRTNYGMTYTAQFNQGGFFNALFGESYQLFGQNSFAQGGTTNTGIDSGLDTRRSDYVARASYQPDRIFTYTTRFRFDRDNWTVRRFEAEARANVGRWSGSLMYGDYDAQPDLGFLYRRQGILGTGQIKIDTNWVVLGGARYDIEAGKFDQTRIGFGYVDDCLIFALNYITSYTYSGNPVADHRVMLQMSLRTIGGTSISQPVGTPASSQ